MENTYHCHKLVCILKSSHDFKKAIRQINRMKIQQVLLDKSAFTLILVFQGKKIASLVQQVLTTVYLTMSTILLQLLLLRCSLTETIL